MKKLARLYVVSFSEVMETQIPFDKKMQLLDILKKEAKSRLSETDYIKYLNIISKSL